MRNIPIDQQLNLEAPLHNGYDFENFVAILNGDKRFKVQVIANEFGVTRATVYLWIKKYKALLGAKNETNTINSS